MNYNVLQNNKFELIAHKLTFKLVRTTATIITTIKKLQRQECHFITYCNMTLIT